MKELNSNELLDLLQMIGLRVLQCEKALDELINQESKTIVTKRMLELMNIKTKLEIQLKSK